MAIKRFAYIGIDEVGRGPLAGPVTVAALALPAGWTSQVLGACDVPKLKDSKKLSEKQREKWFKYIANHPKIFYATASVYPKIIDRINISQAANLAATRALRRVCELISYDQRPTVNELKNSKTQSASRRSNSSTHQLRVFLDGGLFARLPKNSLTHKLINCKTVIRGDEKYNCIKLASIVAKVKRDRIMKRNHKKFPQYGFDKHKGYGTKTHMAVIKKHGPCKLHRLTFLKKLVKI